MLLITLDFLAQLPKIRIDTNPKNMLPPTSEVPMLAAIFFIAGLYVTVQEALEPTVTAEMMQADTLMMSYGALETNLAVPLTVPSATVGGVQSRRP